MSTPLRWGATLLSAVLLMALLLAAAVACEEPPITGNPLLPPGFADTPVPQVPLSTYLYVNQGAPLSFSTTHFPAGDVAQEETLPSLPDSISLNTLRLWSQSPLVSYGALFEFTSEAEAQAVSLLLEARQKEMPDVWHSQEGDNLLLVKGTDPWGDSLKTAVQTGKMVSLQEAYPGVWEVMRALPENPPTSPIAAGFLRMEEGNIEALASKIGIETAGLTPALGFLRLDAIAIAVYSGSPLEIAEGIGPDYLAQSQVGMVFVASSGYPGFVLSTIFSLLEGRTALEEVSLGQNGTAFSLSMEPLHVMLAQRGKLIVGSVGSSREQAGVLLTSALAAGQ